MRASTFSNYTKEVMVESVSLSTLLEEFKISSHYLLYINIKGKESDMINGETIEN